MTLTIQQQEQYNKFNDLYRAFMLFGSQKEIENKTDIKSFRNKLSELTTDRIEKQYTKRLKEYEDNKSGIEEDDTAYLYSDTMHNILYVDIIRCFKALDVEIQEKFVQDIQKLGYHQEVTFLTLIQEVPIKQEVNILDTIYLSFPSLIKKEFIGQDQYHLDYQKTLGATDNSRMDNQELYDQLANSNNPNQKIIIDKLNDLIREQQLNSDQIQLLHQYLEAPLQSCSSQIDKTKQEIAKLQEKLGTILKTGEANKLNKKTSELKQKLTKLGEDQDQILRDNAYLSTFLNYFSNLNPNQRIYFMQEVNKKNSLFIIDITPEIAKEINAGRDFLLSEQQLDYHQPEQIDDKVFTQPLPINEAKKSIDINIEQAIDNLERAKQLVKSTDEYDYSDDPVLFTNRNKRYIKTKNKLNIKSETGNEPCDLCDVAFVELIRAWNCSNDADRELIKDKYPQNQIIQKLELGKQDHNIDINELNGHIDQTSNGIKDLTELNTANSNPLESSKETSKQGNIEQREQNQASTRNFLNIPTKYLMPALLVFSFASLGAYIYNSFVQQTQNPGDDNGPFIG